MIQQTIMGVFLGPIMGKCAGKPLETSRVTQNDELTNENDGINGTKTMIHIGRGKRRVENFGGPWKTYQK